MKKAENELLMAKTSTVKRSSETKVVRKDLLTKFHNIDINPNNIYVQFLNLKYSPSIRLFLINKNNRKWVKFLDNGEIVYTGKRELTEEQLMKQRFDLEYYFNPTLEEIGKFKSLPLYLEEHSQDIKGVIDEIIYNSESNFFKDLKKELDELLKDSETGKEKDEIKISALVKFQNKQNEKLQEYWPEPMPSNEKLERLEKRMAFDFNLH